MIDIKEIKSIIPNKDGSFDVQSKKSSNNYTYFTVNWKRIPRFDQKGNKIDPDIFREDVIAKNGIEYWNQNFACQFLGSSSTLINSKILAQMTPEDPQEIRDNKLKVFAYPKEGHSYIMAVDPAKDGPDGFAIQIVDITTINFEQAAVANLYVDYMLMPEWIVDWGKWYNNAFIIIEKNEGAGTFIANILWQDYSYENLYFDKKKVPNKTVLKKAPYPGFQTTSRTRKLILNNMRMFIEQNKFIIHDKETIEQFYHFILIDEKYQADDGYHDDLIMALAITFAPFCETKNFEDIKGLVDALYDRNQAHNGGSIQKFIPLGFFDSNDDDAVEGIKDRTMPNPFGLGGF